MKIERVAVGKELYLQFCIFFKIIYNYFLY